MVVAGRNVEDIIWLKEECILLTKKEVKSEKNKHEKECKFVLEDLEEEIS